MGKKSQLSRSDLVLGGNYKVGGGLKFEFPQPISSQQLDPPHHIRGSHSPTINGGGSKLSKTHQTQKTAKEKLKTANWREQERGRNPLEGEGKRAKTVAMEAVKEGCKKWVFVTDEEFDEEERH